jgi:hypothetical protein
MSIWRREHAVDDGAVNFAARFYAARTRESGSAISISERAWKSGTRKSGV